MGFTQAIASGFRNYVNFSGRAGRSEYWYWFLFTVIVSVVLAIVDYILFPDAAVSPLYSLFGLAVLLPGVAVGARRLHDLNQSGWWLLLFPFIWGCFFWRGTGGSNRFGPDPLGAGP